MGSCTVYRSRLCYEQIPHVLFRSSTLRIKLILFLSDNLISLPAKQGPCVCPSSLLIYTLTRSCLFVEQLYTHQHSLDKKKQTGYNFMYLD